METKYPELKGLHAVPNGGHRHKAVAMKLKAEGVKPGVPDISLPVKRDPFTGLHIEMKTAKGRVTENQRWWINFLKSQGRRVEVCRSFDEARALICEYLGIKEGER
jgi:hypothetical protein